MEVEEVQQQNEQANTRTSTTIGTNRLQDWHHSRIIRVSRASGGKDRHSKVMTSKGLRDRRVRLSVSTAIQFYDLQDRLGYDQPSKAVEWLINAAAEAIAELPSLNAVYTPPKSDNEKRGSSENGFENCGEMNNLPLSKSACSSNSETSRGSGLSLARSDVRVNRVKARERARERAAKEKEGSYANADESYRGIAQQPNGSFTELLTAGVGHNNNHQQSSQHQQQNISFERVLFHKPAARAQQQMDYSSFSLPQTMFSISGDHHHHRSSQLEMQHFSYVPDYIPVSAPSNGGGGDHYNLNFSMSSSSGSGGLAGFNGGTLQSNSTAPSSASLLSPHHHFQRFSPMESNTNVPFFLGGASASAPTMENHQHQFPFGLQLYGDGSHRHSDHKGKAKN